MGASSSHHSSALATFPVCAEEQRAWLLTLGWPGCLGSQEWHAKGRWQGVEIAGASTENINPSIWKVMAAFEISSFTSVLSPGQGAWAGGVRGGLGKGSLRLCPPAGLGSGAGTAPRRCSRAHGTSGEGAKLGCTFFRVFLGLFCFGFSLFGLNFFSNLSPTSRVPPPPSK